MQDIIKTKLKESMLAKDSVRVQVYRGLTSAFTNELVAQGRPPQEILTDEDCLKVVKKLVKQRKDSIEQFTAGGREDLATDEKAELAILMELLPAQMSEIEIEEFIKNKLSSDTPTADNKGK
ncbi:MAG: GatB/YqeY domain-containing protein [Cyanobium sp. MAG06]|nr:GatB/YqeY domain-containing protein [Cyanobium sp. MAG06]